MANVKLMDLEKVLYACDFILYGAPSAKAPTGDVVNRDKPEPWSSSTLVDISRLRRQIIPEVQSFQENRMTIIKRHAKVNEAGNVETDGNGLAKFTTAEAAAECKREIEELENKTVAIDIVIKYPSAFRRKLRDAHGSVTETDQVEGVIIDGLFDLLVTDESVERAKLQSVS